MDRRLFLKGTGGTIVALPILESVFLDPKAKAAASPPPFAIFLYQPMGPEKDRWWPSRTGPITAASLDNRGTSPLKEFADKLLFINGLGHGNETHSDSGDHGESTTMTLSAASAEFGSNEWQDKSSKRSFDHVICDSFGGTPLNLATAMTPKDKGPYISWSAPSTPATLFTEPLEIYKRLFPNGEKKTNAGNAPAVDPLKALRKGVNDLVKAQMDALLKSPKLSKNDKDRLALHMSNIRDVENKILTDKVMSEEQRVAIEKYTMKGSSIESRATAPKLLTDLMAIAAASGVKRSMTLQLGPADLDTNYKIVNGKADGNGWHNNVSHANEINQLFAFDQLNQKNFAELLKSLQDYEFGESGKTLLDYGVSTFIISLGWGMRHWRHDLPHVMAGSANGALVQGQYIDLIPDLKNEKPGGFPAENSRAQKFIPTNRLFSTLAKAMKVTKSQSGAEIPELKNGFFNVETGTKKSKANKSDNVRETQEGYISSILTDKA